MKVQKNYILFLLFHLGLALNCSGASGLRLTGLSCEYKTNPLDIDVVSPRLSWKIISPGRGISQGAYEIRVSTDARNFTSEQYVVWKSGKVHSAESVYIRYGGKVLQAARRYYWQVRIWDNKGHVSSWSEPDFWEMGLLRRDDWKAKWIVGRQDRNKGDKASPLFRKDFRITGDIRRARLYITAQGLYEARINGARVGEDYFTPGWTSYHKRLQYQVYDVTGMVRQGDNAIGATLGEGWFAGRLSGGIRYGNQLALLAQLQLEYEDGRVEHIVSDGSWKTSQAGPVRASEIYDGEIYDARMEIRGWSSPGFDAAGWEAVGLHPAPVYDNLVTSAAPPVKKHEVIRPVAVISTPAGEKVFDFGQNLTGWVRFRVKGRKGDSIVISHAEVLDQKGNFYTENLRSAKQRIVYYIKGEGEEEYEPHFSFQGFRYIRIEGARDSITRENTQAVVLHSAMKPTGVFTTSNPLINQLQHNIEWGQKGNFLDVPTDCPQRDERLGWTGDAQVFFNTASFNMDASGFFAKWLQDLKADQQADGGVPQIVPNIWGEGGRSAGSAGWADAATIIPLGFYNSYGDKDLLAAQYPSMKAWLDYIGSKSSGYLWDKTWHHGDWLYFIPEHVWDYDPAVTDKTLIAQAFYAHSVSNVIRAAAILGKKDDETKYADLLEKVKAAFVKNFMSGSGALLSNTQTAYVLALQFDLLPEEFRQQAAERLAANIAAYGNHLSTGFLGTPYLCHVLSRFGYHDLAYTLLMQESYPSWLYPVKMGATTIWERWDGIKPDGSFQSKDMNSFNHYSYGAIGDWMYRNVAGISQREGFGGYKEFEISVRPGGGLTFASAGLETVYGKIISSWKLSDKSMTLQVEVPVNTTAHIRFPDADIESLRESGKPVILPEGSKVLTLGSGKYDFNYRLKT